MLPAPRLQTEGQRQTPSTHHRASLPSNYPPGKAHNPNHLPVYLLSITLDNTLHHIVQQTIVTSTAFTVS
jgi:hypothetical protein